MELLKLQPISACPPGTWKVVGSCQELPQNLSLMSEVLPSNISLTLGNSRISETNLSNGLVFMVFQKPVMLNLHAKLSGIYIAVSNATMINK